ncbi:MAG: PorV/PorQ family protein [Chitinivibrionales bacterium]|nr:PorV/PorQ family protein [Chitinivibrionales bacterium]
MIPTHRTRTLAFLAFLGFSLSIRAAFETAVITLVFPPGARATGLGEAFTALADDANATFFNPAGLGQAPLANSWRPYLERENTRFYAIAATKRKEFALRDKIWAASSDGLLRYNGKVWVEHEIYLIEQDEDIEDIIELFLDTDDEAVIEKAIQEIKETNRIEGKRRKQLAAYFAENIYSGEQKIENAEKLTQVVLDLPAIDRDSSGIQKAAKEETNTQLNDGALNSILEILAIKDTRFEDLVELKLPYSLVVKDSITALAVDASENLWIGTPAGLWRYDGSSFLQYSVVDGLPSDYITSLAVGPYDEIAAGTDMGLAIFTSEGIWEAYEFETDVIKQSYVNAVTFADEKNIYIGTPYGLLHKSEDDWLYFDTADGLLSRNVTALHYDSDDHLWIGGENGLSIYDQTSWKRYKFPRSTIYSFAELSSGKMWIGTNRGAIRYRAGRTRLAEDGSVVEEPPEWKPFHSKNALKGDEVRDIAIHGKDVWLTTDKAINQYDHAEMQTFLFWELLLPTLNLRDLWHTYFAYIYPTADWGTLGATVNFINFGENALTDEDGREIAKFRSWEGVFGLSYGMELRQDFSFGVNAKYAHSALAPGIGEGDEGIGRTFAIDASILKRNLFIKGLDLGLMFQNMGPPIFYISRDESDPIPFTVILGLAYRALQTPIHDLNLLLDLKREFAKNYIEKNPDPFYKAIFTDLQNHESWREEVEEINIHMGMEYWYVHFLAARLGFLFDYIGQRYELTIGIGLKYGSMSFDFSYIHSPEGFMKNFVKTIDKDNTDGSHGVRHGQPRFSLIFSF